MSHSSAFPAPAGKSYSCSTFMLRDENAFLIGHNLDDPSDAPVPGVVVFNKRGVQKGNISFYEILTAKKPPSPALNWTSKYGSITFNTWGREFVDGGVNETGLYIQEMTLREVVFPEDDTLPRMFMMPWMQYQLDNFESVEQVLASIPRIIIDGWPWHFFVSDKDGNCAAIEFIKGKPHIYTGESMPIPVLCNTAYPQEMSNLENYAGFGGETPVDTSDMTVERFVHAANLIQNAESASVDYAFEILKNLERRGVDVDSEILKNLEREVDLERSFTEWSYVIDVKDQKVYWHTQAAPKRKHVDMNAFDFSCDTPARMLDIHADLEGDVAAHFAPYSPELNKQFVNAGLGWMESMAEYVQARGGSMQNMIDAVAGFPASTDCSAPKTTNGG